ncbi:MAG: PEP-utilizing enzyme [Defluviitaleaceae bacterium]|nr:PEP-utilizing enzyme [Defluviitaleaceae bacterium]
MIYTPFNYESSKIGAKALSLARLQVVDCQIPVWFAVSSGECSEQEIIEMLSDFDDESLFAVRSSSQMEDGVHHSFAGQFETYLNVSKADVLEKIALVQNSHTSTRIQAYLKENNMTDVTAPAVLVQKMVNADVAGVAFSANPITGNTKECVISAVAGLGDKLVEGLVDGEDFTVIDDVVTGEGILSKAQCLEIAKLCRALSQFFGHLQDIEWAYEKGQLYLLQSRPITSLKKITVKSDHINIWDNSNIAESYNGVTTPLTFSFIRSVYGHVYRDMGRVMGIKEEKIQEEDYSLTHMLGLHNGQVYYNLLSWYKLIAVLPGYKNNARFMEQMMGVKEGLSDEVRKLLPPPSKSTIFTVILKLSKHHRQNPKQVKKFYMMLDEVLRKDLSGLSLFELAQYYRELEDKLFKKWHAPVVNDFLASIFYGLLRATSTKWGQIDDEHKFNTLLKHSGDIISTEPAKLIKEMAILIKDNEALTQSFIVDPIAKVKENLPPDIKAKIAFYLNKFGDRCINELKLESETLNDDPTTLYRAIGTLAKRLHRGELQQVEADDSEQKIQIKGLKRVLYNWILKHARRTIVNRENLRFERTRAFGSVRSVFREIGTQLASFKVIESRDDIFYLEYNEILSFIEGCATTWDLKGLIEVRKTEYASYGDFDENRFETYDCVGLSKRHIKEQEIELTGDVLTGLGCCPGIVRGRAKVISNPKDATIHAGEILVAKRTDPGWIMLFPPSAGVLVEYGSLLSHTAIVVREMGIPAVVSVKHLTTTIETGDLIELDGEKGVVRIIEKGNAY